MNGVVWRAAVIGAVDCAVLCLISEHRSLSADWFLAVMILFDNISGFGLPARYRVSLIGVVLAGCAGMMAGGWIGVHTLGCYEYTVPTPREDRELRIITPGRERVLELTAVPEQTIRRIPVGGGLGVLVGWGAGVYAWLSRPRGEGPAFSGADRDA